MAPPPPALPLHADADDDPGAAPFARTLRLTALIVGAVCGALATSVALLSHLLAQAIFLLASLAFFSGVPLGYLSTARPAALRIARWAALGLAAGSLAGALAVRLFATQPMPLPDLARDVGITVLVFGLVGFLFLTLGALLGRRAGAPHPMRRRNPPRP